jgi:hypothetical protein
MRGRSFSTYFQPSDMPLLCRYAEANALAARAAAALLQAGPIVAGDKPSAWLAVHAVASKQVSALAMRLTARKRRTLGASALITFWLSRYPAFPPTRNVADWPFATFRGQAAIRSLSE